MVIFFYYVMDMKIVIAKIYDSQVNFKIILTFEFTELFIGFYKITACQFVHMSGSKRQDKAKDPNIHMHRFP